MDARLKPIPVIDGHIHFDLPAQLPDLDAWREAFQIAKLNFVCTHHPTRISRVPEALFLKAHYPSTVYVFGGLDMSSLFSDPENCGQHFADYLDVLAAMGCDGVKMIEGKPTTRKRLPIPPFDSPAYEPYWVKMEATATPLVFHVNDPEEFWDDDLVPDWAVEQGWSYGDRTYINNETQYAEVRNVMERHPNLSVIFAHFYFLSAQLERLGGYLDRYPNMHVDLTPGVEMYHNFAKQPEKVREFFIRYQDRIVFGTDLDESALFVSGEDELHRNDSDVRIHLIRLFLETEGAFAPESSAALLGEFEKPFQGIHLPQEVLEKIYHKNFEKLAGRQPRALQRKAIAAECQRLLAYVETTREENAHYDEDTAVLSRIYNYFAAVS